MDELHEGPKTAAEFNSVMARAGQKFQLHNRAGLGWVVEDITSPDRGFTTYARDEAEAARVAHAYVNGYLAGQVSAASAVDYWQERWADAKEALHRH